MPVGQVLSASTGTWSSIRGYAFPPIGMIGRCLSGVLQQDLRCHHWFWSLLSGKVKRGSPRLFTLPASLRLATGTTCSADSADRPGSGGSLLVENQTLSLVAWKLSGLSLLAEGFRRNLRNFCWHQGALEQRKFTSLPGTNGLIGVTNGISIPWMPL